MEAILIIGYAVGVFFAILAVIMWGGGRWIRHLSERDV
jgi:ABC-type microcin C transport system permease subunit YejB